MPKKADMPPPSPGRPEKDKSGKGPSRKREGKAKPTNEAVSALFAHLGGKDQSRLVELWRHWAMVLGDGLSPLGRPLGHKDRTLLIGSDDSMAMQELSMQSEEILERVNAFMNEDYFTRVKVLLMQDHADLARERPKRQAPPPAPEPPGPHIGKVGDRMNPDSPVTRCYQAWVERSRKRP